MSTVFESGPMYFRIGEIVVIGIVSGVLQAQPLSFGVKAGVSFMDAVEGNFGIHSEERRYAIGPTVEIRLPLSFAAEISALYRRTGYSTVTVNGFFPFTSLSRVRANSWEVPILMKYYLPGHERPWRLFVEGGYVIRRLSNAEDVVSEFGTSAGRPFSTRFNVGGRYLLRENPTHGIAAGAGVRLGLGRLRLS